MVDIRPLHILLDIVKQMESMQNLEKLIVNNRCLLHNVSLRATHAGL